MATDFATSPPPPSERVRALMEALEAERVLGKLKEAELARKEAEMRKVKNDAGMLQARIEEEEEFIANNLLRRLEQATQEKAHLARQVEKEEDFLTNILQKKLDEVRQEKVELELHLETEQEYIVNKLQKQLTEVIRQKNALQAKLSEGHSGLISKLEQSLETYKERLQAEEEDRTRPSIVHLEAQIRSMHEQQDKLDTEAEGYHQMCTDLEKRLEEVKKDHFIMQAKAHRFREKLQQLQLQREAELLQTELSEEWSFNHRIKKSPAVSLRSRSASEACPPHPKSLVPPTDDGRFRSQSVTVSARPVPRRRGPLTLTPPRLDSPHSGEMPSRAASRSELRFHTVEVLQMSRSPRNSRFTGALPRGLPPHGRP
eukprot:TRINITY_DN4654_c0_g1_i1.p1 TRINITY_DN4654_c0_g1~~TRINITY_DN4654_c0_g1_i1.p1  ORF type:complete len:381 (+),score=106.65 TRINITY_DN4654_c0_g1_i1:29-1144(+)